jgi:molybdenum cofactor cytidylyltransferase
MSRAPSFAGVILAAGESSRMGSDKALLAWPPPVAGESVATGTFLSGAIASLAPSTDFVLVVNADPSRGQFSSLQLGMREVLNRGRDAAIVTLVDRPPASAATVQTLREAFEAAPSSIWAVVPEFSGRHGHPFVAGRDMIERFLREPVTGNARDVEHRYQEHIQYLAVDDPFVALNINTPEDYAALGR